MHANQNHLADDQIACASLLAQRNHLFANNGGTAGFRVVVDPTPLPDGQTIVYAALAGPAGGLWRSLDTGNTWQKLSTVTA
ncbi:MAG: hypothetical protein MUC38_13120, partial [Cyclobacteriaceae bacterium]|nr:hypothetical protein [Cyclobacteriaceae bacterium]